MPIYLDVYIAPLRDCLASQVLTIALLMLMAMDVIFGVLNACVIVHNFSSDRMRIGLVHKCTFFGILIVGLISDALIAAGVDLKELFGIDGNMPIYPAVCGAIIVLELGSLLEIFVQMNPDLKKIRLFRILASVNQEEEATDA